jgi:aminoglycoside 6-adenylyltransferase
MSTKQTPSDRFLGRFTEWARDRDDVKAALLVGSRARSVMPADEWSDLDIMLITTRPKRYLRTTDWLAALAPVCLTYVIEAPVGDRHVRHVVFEGPVMVDFAVVSSLETRWGGLVLRMVTRAPLTLRLIPQGLRSQLTAWFDTLRKGRPLVLVDKGHAASRLQNVRLPDFAPSVLHAHEFSEAVNAFWSLTMWVAKLTLRGELWSANWVAGHQLQEELLRMIEWHAKAEHGGDYDTWFAGRFIGSWAAPNVVARLTEVFARYDEGDIWHALFAAMDLYGRVARETAGRQSLDYPTSSEQRVVDWINHWRATHAVSASAAPLVAEYERPPVSSGQL